MCWGILIIASNLSDSPSTIINQIVVCLPKSHPKLIIITCELLQPGKMEINNWPICVVCWLAVIKGFSWHLGLHLLAVIHVWGMATIYNIISSALYEWVYVWNHRISGHILGTGAIQAWPQWVVILYLTYGFIFCFI